MSRKYVWMILVPTARKDGRPIHRRFHRIWDKKVREITGGLTILKPVKGKWNGLKNHVIEERMIPIHIVGTREQINKIVNFSLTYYEQDAILAYRFGSDVIMKYK